MSKKILFQSLLKFRDQIKDGTAKVQDIITDYFNQTGKSVTDEERAIILNEFAKDAPDNVTTFEGVDAVETILPTRGPNVQKAGDMSDTPFTDKVKKDQGIESLRGDESFGELLEKMGPPDDRSFVVKDFDKNLDQLSFSRFNKAYKDLDVDEKDSILDTMKKIGDEVFGTKEEGIGSLFPKDKSGYGFDDRAEAAEFVRKMRGAGIKNEDIRKIFKENPPYKRGSAFLGQDRDKMILDLEPGKRAATTLARAADMGADTKIKQELLSELDEMKLDKGPRFFNEEYMGYDDFIKAMEAKKIEVNNAIVDDLEAMGVADEDVMRIMGMARESNRSNFYTSGEEFVDIIKEELDFNDINYNVDFYKNYFRELESLMRKPEPRFMYGGLA